MLDDDDLDPLYELPLEEFVPARNALVKRLSSDGRADDAALAKKLAKPSISAWAINRLVRSERKLVQELVAAVDRLRAAQLGALDGRDDAPSMSEATKDERDVLARIEDAVPKALDQAGYVASRNTIDRVLRSIRAAAADVDGRVALEAGRMTGDYEASGFDMLAAQASPAPPPPPRPEARRARDTIDLEMEAAKRQAELKRAEQAELRRLEEARRDEDEARRARQRRMDGLRRTLEAAREAETRLEREHNNARRDHAEAERRLKEAERLAQQVEQRLLEARGAREEAEGQLQALKAEATKR